MQKTLSSQLTWKTVGKFLLYFLLLASFSYAGLRHLASLFLPRACGGGLIVSFGILFKDVSYNKVIEDLAAAKCEFSYSDDMQIVFRRLSAEQFKILRSQLKNFDVEPAQNTDRRFQRRFAETPIWWKFDSSHRYFISRSSPFDGFLEGLKFLVQQKPTYIVDITNPKVVEIYAYVKWR